ncbi:HD domain-containing protein [Meiothermus sp.]|uniref:HD domain-containing protein n=1 Tax=Meiothermus sp. TaxID=1955249 RepID=UPI00307D943C
MQIPTPQEAEQLLQEAERSNPGHWPHHVRYVAQAARRIAEHHPTLDPEAGYVLGLLHDVGRRKPGRIRHIVDGYNLLTELGYPDAARICLTHGYPLKTLDSDVDPPHKWDLTDEEVQFVRGFLEHTHYNEYDRLIQLCDSLALPSGFCTLEKRQLDIALRYGVNEWSVRRWQAYFALLDRFNQAIGRPVYSLLDGIVENTLGFKP